MSNLAQQRIREAKEKKLTRLDIGNCGLTEIPEEVFELTWLEEFDYWSKRFSNTRLSVYLKSNR